MIRLKLILLATALVLAAALTARAGSATDAYFSDTKAGVISGALGAGPPTPPPQSPCTYEPGDSTARHWDGDEATTAHNRPIARLDRDGRLSLDFGDDSAGNSKSSPDVFRIISHDVAPRHVYFVVRGDLSAMIDRVGLKDRESIMAAGATASVRIRVKVPLSARPGEYTGELIVSVEGSGTMRIPMRLVVKAHGQGGEPGPEPSAPPQDPTPTPTATPSCTPSVTPSPTPTSDRCPTPVPTPQGDD